MAVGILASGVSAAICKTVPSCIDAASVESPPRLEPLQGALCHLARLGNAGVTFDGAMAQETLARLHDLRQSSLSDLVGSLDRPLVEQLVGSMETNLLKYIVATEPDAYHRSRKLVSRFGEALRVRIKESTDRKIQQTAKSKAVSRR